MRFINNKGLTKENILLLWFVKFFSEATVKGQFIGQTPADAIAALSPDLCLKGGDYTLENLPEYPTVAAYGGKFEIHPVVGEYSTSAVIYKILATYWA